MNEEDTRILEAFRSKKGWAVRLVKDRVEPLIKNKIFSFHDWEDAQQQCLLELFEAVMKTPEIRNLWGFVRRIAVTTVIDYNRRLSMRRAWVVSLNGQADGDNNPRNEVIDRTPTQDVAYENKDLFLYIYQRLGRDCQRLFRLIYIQGLSYTEAAAELRITEGNLRVRTHRCKERAIAIGSQYLVA